MEIVKFALCAVVAQILLLAALPACCMCMGYDLSSGFNDDSRQSLLIITGVTKPVDKLDPKAQTPFHVYPTDRTIVVDRVLFGLEVAKGSVMRFTVPSGGIDGNADGRLVDGKPVLLILRRNEQQWVFGSGVFYSLGPIGNCMLSLKSLDDPQVDYVQRMIDLASIPSSAARWERVQALLPHAQHDPVLLEFLLNAQDSLFRWMQEDFSSYVSGMLGQMERYAPTSYVFVDQLLTGNDPLGGFGSRDEIWTQSPERKKLFATLAAGVKQDDPCYAYIDYAQRTLAGDNAVWPVSKVTLLRDLSSTLGNPQLAVLGVDDPYNNRRFEAPPFVAVVKSPGIDSGVHTVEMLETLTGNPLWINNPGRITFQQPLPTGIYVLFMRGIYNGENPTFGKETFILGSVVNALQVASVNDPAIDDVKRLLMLIGQPQTARWQRTFERGLSPLGLEEIAHPLILNFYLRSRVNLLKELAAASDATLLQILTHPDQYTHHTVTLADRLFTGIQSQNWAFKQFDWLTSAARTWKTSPQRKILLEGLRKSLTPEDKLWSNGTDNLLKDTLKKDYGE